MSRPGDDDLPRVTASLLRRADSMCPRRLAHEHASGKKLTSLGGGAFEVANRIQADATTGHADPSLPLERAFVDPPELDPEQRALYRAAARGYLSHFAGSPARSDEIGWETEVPDVGVRLVGPVGIAVRGDDGMPELRVVRLGAPRLVDDVDMHFTILRAAEWAPERLKVVVVDVLQDESVHYDIEVPVRHAGAVEWLRARVDVIRARADRSRPRAGADCRSCSCIPGCPPVTRGP